MQEVLPELVSVSELNRLARGLLERGLPPLWVSGEISNLTVAASGHAYFSLKDKGGQIRAVMFRGRVAGLPFRLREGVQVEAFGQVSLYEARGDYQIQLDRMREAGLGRLFEAFERLKRQLGEEGLFDPARKRPLPAFPRRIGIVSSPSGAALLDVVSTLRRRMPSAHLVLYPTLVQGEAAPAQIVAAITQAALRQEVDVLMVCRGGGSIEDLWAFNDETVARALAACPIPTISGVGHETDFTIADFVADLRAPTPTGAAEQVCPDRQALLAELAQREQRLRRAMQRLLHSRMQALDALSARLTHPGQRLRQQAQLLQRDQARLASLARSAVQQAGWRLERLAERHARLRPQAAAAQAGLDALAERLRQAMRRQLAQAALHQQHLADRLSALNPQAVLQRGYAIVENRKGQAVRSPDALKQSERVTLRLADGVTQAEIRHPDGGQRQLDL